MTLPYLLRYTLPSAFALLPPAMDTPDARVLLLAIGLQESKFSHRLQIGGPARGYWQFEQGGGVRGVRLSALRVDLLPVERGQQVPHGGLDVDGVPDRVAPPVVRAVLRGPEPHHA